MVKAMALIGIWKSAPVYRQKWLVLFQIQSFSDTIFLTRQSSLTNAATEIPFDIQSQLMTRYI